MTRKLPTSLKEARGTKRTSRTNKDEPLPDDDEIVPPDHLSVEAVKVWEKEVPRLRAMGILGNPDIPMLAMYCEYFAEWKAGMKQLNKEGMVIMTKKTRTSGATKARTSSTVPVLNPLYHTTNKRFDQCMKIMGQFGMSPVARSNVSAAPGKTGKNSKKAGFLDLESA